MVLGSKTAWQRMSQQQARAFRLPDRRVLCAVETSAIHPDSCQNDMTDDVYVAIREYSAHTLTRFHRVSMVVPFRPGRPSRR